MPVLITGATGMVGRALASRLLAEGGQVRAYVRREDPSLRAAGVHLAIGQACDVPKLESALTSVCVESFVATRIPAPQLLVG
jgi:uncharacterized protein YbjT (DUF2867 family)